MNFFLIYAIILSGVGSYMKKADINKYVYTSNSAAQYARPPRLVMNLNIIFKFILTLLAIFSVSGLIILCYLVSYFLSLKDDDFSYDFSSLKLELASQIYIPEENQAFKEYDSVSDVEKRIWVDFQNIPVAMKNAVIAIEDTRF
jgi:penicillin-binding protein 1A